MSADFVSDVLPTVRRYAVRWLPDQVEDVETLAWLLWRKKPDAPPGPLAKYAVKSLRARPVNEIGFGATHAGCALAWSRVQLVADYDGADPSPGPARRAEVRDRWRRWWDTLTTRERALVWATEQGYRGRDLARAVGCSREWVSHLRGRLKRKWARCG